MAFVSRDALKRLLLQHVVELKFQRRHPKPDTKTCRMLCTGAYPNFHTNKFLASVAAQAALNYRYPKGTPPYPPVPYFSPDQKNLVITWDVFMQDYRCISIYRCNVIRAFPVDTRKNTDSFWKYFKQYLSTMSAQEKMDFRLK